eukprot:7954870-Pyramimonas_sp.AAC.1
MAATEAPSTTRGASLSLVIASRSRPAEDPYGGGWGALAQVFPSCRGALAHVPPPGWGGLAQVDAPPPPAGG